MSYPQGSNLCNAFCTSSVKYQIFEWIIKFQVIFLFFCKNWSWLCLTHDEQNAFYLYSEINDAVSGDCTLQNVNYFDIYIYIFAWVGAFGVERIGNVRTTIGLTMSITCPWKWNWNFTFIYNRVKCTGVASRGCEGSAHPVPESIKAKTVKSVCFG